MYQISKVRTGTGWKEGAKLRVMLAKPPPVSAPDVVPPGRFKTPLLIVAPRSREKPNGLIEVSKRYWMVRKGLAGNVPGGQAQSLWVAESSVQFATGPQPG